NNSPHGSPRLPKKIRFKSRHRIAKFDCPVFTHKRTFPLTRKITGLVSLSTMIFRPLPQGAREEEDTMSGLHPKADTIELPVDHHPLPKGRGFWCFRPSTCKGGISTFSASGRGRDRAATRSARSNRANRDHHGPDSARRCDRNR